MIADTIKHITIEGPDLAGKSTVFKQLWKNLQEENSYKLFLSDRGPFSVLCYGKFYNRYSTTQLQQLEADVLNFLHSNIVVYIRTPDEVNKALKW